MVEVGGQGTAPDPVTGCVLFKNGRVERIQSVQLDDDTTVQNRNKLHQDYWFRLLFQYRIVSVTDQAGAHAFRIFDIAKWAKLDAKQLVGERICRNESGILFLL